MPDTSPSVAPAPPHSGLTGTTARRLILVALVVGGALRLYRLHWGLADGTWSVDEGLWGLRLDPRTPPAVFRDPAICLVYPTLYEHWTWLVHALVGPHATATSSDPEGAVRAYLTGVFDPQFAAIIAAARTASALASLAGIGALALLGWQLYGPSVGALAALLLATSPLEILQVHSASTDPLLAAVGTLALLASWWLARTGSTAAALVAGGTAGLGFATKYTGLVFVCPVAWAWWHAGRSRPRRLATLAPILAAAVVAGAAAGCPRCFADPAGLFHILGWHRRLAAAAPFDGNRLAESLGWYGRPWLYQIVASLPYALGAPVHLAALAGIVVAALRRTPGDRLVLALLVPYFVVIGHAPSTFPRFLLVLVPGLLLLAARSLVALPRRAVGAISGLLVGYSLALSLSDVGRLSWGQQAEVARFLVPRVAASGPVAFPNYGGYFRLQEALGRAAVSGDARMPGQWFTRDAPFFVMPEWYAIAIRRDHRNPALLRDLDALESGAAGYRPRLRLEIPWYLQRALDERIDPGLATDVWQGAIGFTVYERVPPEGRER